MSIALIAISAGVGGGLILFRELGRTPGELLDYAQRRLEGHTRLEALILPIVGMMRSALDAPSAAERSNLPFLVPPPPPRRGANSVAAAPPAPPGATVWRVGPGGPLLRIADAAQRARDGDVVEIEAGDYYGDVAVWEQKRLTIRGVGGAARLHAGGRSAEGKAIWVLRSGEFSIANIDFVGAKVEDGNGAGIRFEGGSLHVSSCLFWGNQTGILTSNSDIAADAILRVENSEFAYSHVDGHWAHNLYVGSIASVSITGSYFHHTDSGHLLKSRARVSHVLYNRFTDESGGRASYELDFPNGGLVRLVGNIVQQQRGTENSTVIAFGEEGYRWPLNVLLMGNNTLVNDLPYGGTFVAVAPGAQRVVSTNNLLVGPGVYRVRDPIINFNDVHAEWEDLVLPSRQDYRLRQATARMAYRALLTDDQGESIVPVAQYRHPLTVSGLLGAPAVVGAEQLVGTHGREAVR